MIQTTGPAPLADDILTWNSVDGKWMPDSTVNSDIATNTANISANATNISANTNALNNFVIGDCVNVDGSAPNSDDVLTWDQHLQHGKQIQQLMLIFLKIQQIYQIIQHL